MDRHSADSAATRSSDARDTPEAPHRNGGAVGPVPDPAAPALGVAAGSVAGALLGRLVGSSGRGALLGGALGGAVGALLTLGRRSAPIPSRGDVGPSDATPSRRLEEGDPKRPAASEPLGSWTKARLYDRAKELGIPGRSKMTKAELLRALRRHPALSEG